MRYSEAIILCLVINYGSCANILGMFTTPSFSHQIVFQPIWRELSLRGHQVTVITPDPLNDPLLVNLTEISIRSAYEDWHSVMAEIIPALQKSVFSSFNLMCLVSDTIIDNELSNPQVKALIADETKRFDVILIEYFHPAVYGLAARFNAPVIAVSSLGVTTVLHDILGNPSHPALYPDVLLNLRLHEGQLSIWDKIKSVVYTGWWRYQYYHIITPRAHEIAKKHFGDDIPYVGDIQNNISLLFTNTNPVMYPPRPLVPAVIELGLMHIKSVKPLPQDLQQILDEAKEGVVYLSLGTNVKSVHLTEALRNNIIGALSELPYKVLWKYEADHLPNKPANVFIRQWLPQQDVLAHPNIKAFITQGGLQSAEEAISRKVPLIGMPFFGDQPMNVQKFVELGIGVAVDPLAVTKDELKKAVIEVAQNPKYKNKITELGDFVNDKPMTGLENAIWWTEYVIRHKGAKYLRSPSADISWFDYLFLDVLSVIAAIGVVFIYLVCKLLKKLRTRDKTKVKSS